MAPRGSSVRMRFGTWADCSSPTSLPTTARQLRLANYSSPTTARQLQLQDEPLRIFQALLDAYKEGHGVLAIDDAVVIAQRQVHHRPHHDLPIAHHRPILDAVHAQDARLWRVEDGRR